MKKIVLTFSTDEYEIIKYCFSNHPKFNGVFNAANWLPQDDCVELVIPDGQLDTFMKGLVEALRAKGTINSIYTRLGLRIESIIDRLTTEFYG